MSILSRINQHRAKNDKNALSVPSRNTRGKDYARTSILARGIISFHFSDKDRTALNVVKRVCNRYYDEDDDCWKAPLSLDCIEKLREGSFEIDPKILRWESELFEPPQFDPNFNIPGLQHPEYLHPYQWEGVQHIEWWDGRALLADDQGLGKTLQVLAWLQYRPEVRPALIICPAIAKLTWSEEAMFWMDNPTVQIISGNKPVDINAEIVIINYDILTQTKKGEETIRPDIWNVNWQLVALDEAHNITNKECQRGWAVDNITAKAPHVIPITATPARHRPKELYTLIHMVDERIFPSYFKYAHRYCGPSKGYTGGWEFNGSSNELELNDILMKSVMIRRKKQEVFKQLPDKVRIVVPFEISNRKEYDEVETDFAALIERQDLPNKTNHIFAKMELLRQLAIAGKIKDCVEWLWNLLETTEKVVVFAEHSTTLDILQKEFGSISVRVDGSNNDPKKREAARKSFQRCKTCGVMKERHTNDPKACTEYVYDLTTRVFLASRAGITNITLTAAEHVVFMELWNSPSDLDQAEDRVYGRAGDLHGATAWYLVAHNTIESRTARMLDLKNRNLTKVMDGKLLDDKMMLTMLLKDYQNGGGR